MMKRVIFCGALAAAPVLLVSCGADSDMPVLAGNVAGATGTGEGLYQEAKQADQSGDTKRAVKLYNQVATQYPFVSSAASARFRQAQLLDQQGEVEKAFDAYDKFLTQFPASPDYSAALNRQAAMAEMAAEGGVKSSFLGIKAKISLEKTVEMLNKVRTNAPKSRTASRAQLATGRLYQSKKKPREAIAAYRQLVADQPDSPDAPEAMYLIGVTMMEDAERGNQNQANVDLAREAFGDYLNQYPGHHRNAEARKYLSTIGGTDMQRSFDVAEFYLKTGRTESAKVYYRDIVKRSGSGKLHDAAKARLKELGE